MATQAAVHQRNLESSILFIQQEHASTLKALHEEIHMLQKKCTDLTFQLTMNGCGGESDTKAKEHESELSAYKTENTKLLLDVELKNRKIKALESDNHAQKKKYLGEIRSQTQIINNLKAELEAKSHNIAYLTTEYHKLKLKEKVNNDSTDPSIRRTVAPSYLPTPPRDIQTKLRRHNRRGLHEENHSRPLRVTSSKSSGSSRSQSPDITPFVQKEESLPIIDRRKQTSVLPPISRSISQEKNTVVVQQVMPPSHLGRLKQESTSPEIATLAVDQLSRAEHGLVHRKEFHSTEYK